MGVTKLNWRTRPLANATTWVYRLYDADGLLATGATALQANEPGWPSQCQREGFVLATTSA